MVKTKKPRDMIAALLANVEFRPRIADTNKAKKCSKLKRRAWKTKGEY